MQESQSLTSGTGQPTFIKPVSFISSSSSLSPTYSQSTSSIYETPERTESTRLSSSLSSRITKLFYTVTSPSCSIVFTNPALSGNQTNLHLTCPRFTARLLQINNEHFLSTLDQCPSLLAQCLVSVYNSVRQPGLHH